MPKVSPLNLKPLKTIYNPLDVHAPASMKQKNLILILCERRKVPPPQLDKMEKGQAAEIISAMLNR